MHIVSKFTAYRLLQVLQFRGVIEKQTKQKITIRKRSNNNLAFISAVPKPVWLKNGYRNSHLTSCFGYGKSN